MSLSFSLIAKKSKLRIWIGQGHHMERSDGIYPPTMTSFYYGEIDTMKKLHLFLDTTQGEDLELVCHEHQEDSFFTEYKEFE